MPKLVLVDGHAYAYRAYYGIRDLRGPNGQPTNAIYGFIKALDKIQGGVEPTHLAVVWDGGVAKERLVILPDYKANRPPMPEPLAQQLSGMRDYLEATRIASLRESGVEADDLIAAATRFGVDHGAQVLVASPDKDFMQLVSDRVGLINPGDSNPTNIWRAEQVRKKTGVDPGQIVDWLSLIGDKVDNIAGVPGVGPVNATKLLNAYKSIENLLARLDEIEPVALRERLRGCVDRLHRNRELIRLNGDVVKGFDWDAFSLQSPADDRLKALLADWGFKSLVAAPLPAQPEQAELFASGEWTN